MGDWVHCNSCYRQPGGGLKYFLTNCGHLFCSDCLIAGTKEKCKVCGCSPCNTIHLSQKMQPDVEVFFTDPIELSKKQHKQLVKVLDFQRGQRQRLTKHRMEMNKKHELIVQKAQRTMEHMKNFEREFMVLREENSYLKRLMATKSGSPQGRSSSTSPSGSNMYVSSGNSPVGSQRMTGHSPQKNSTYFAKGRISPSNQDGTPPCGPARVTLRLPPSQGRMGLSGRSQTPPYQSQGAMGSSRPGSTPSPNDSYVPGAYDQARTSPMMTSPVFGLNQPTPKHGIDNLALFKTPTRGINNKTPPM